MSSSAFSTPIKGVQTPAAAQDSPGNWRHPHLAEITRRHTTTNFTERNMKKIAFNVGTIICMIALAAVARRYLPNPPPTLKKPLTIFTNLLLFIPILNIIHASLPLFWSKDEIADIPLTPAQRKLLGLTPSSAPPSPASAISTPPRYSRTPSFSSASPNGRPRLSSSPLSGTRGAAGGAGAEEPFSPTENRLVKKALHGARRSSIGGASPEFGASLFGESLSLSPGNGKRSSVGLNSKWLYERGRRSGGEGWLRS